MSTWPPQTSRVVADVEGEREVPRVRMDPLSPKGPKRGMPSAITAKRGECCPAVSTREGMQLITGRGIIV